MDQVLFLAAALVITFLGLLLYWVYLRSRLSALRRSVGDLQRDQDRS